MRIVVCLLLGALSACARQEPPAGAAAPAPQSAVQRTSIPSAAQLERFRKEGPAPTLRKIAVADYWLHYKLMQTTGIEKELGGEAQAVSALKALGEAYERRARGAETEIPKMIRTDFTGEGMASGLMGMGVGSFVGMVTGRSVSSLSDREISALTQAGPMKRSGESGSFEMQIGKDGSVTQSTEFEVNEHGINGKVKMTLRMDTCPDESGRVTIDIDVNSQMSVQGKPGTGGYVHTQMKYERYLDDDAHLIDGDDGSASKSRVRMGGFENFQQQSMDITFGYERGGAAISGAHGEQGFNIALRPDETRRASEMLEAVALLQTLVAEATLRGMGSSAGAPWESGRCIDLKVTSSPAKRTGLRPNTAFDLVASPRAKSDGAAAGGTVTATLTGGAQLQPASGKVRADARYGYAGPEKKGEAASIAFESRSKRGVGRATLDFDTRASYRVNGASGGASFTGEICSLDKPFVLTVDSITGTWPMEFTPGDGLSGQMKGTYSSDDCTLTGGGPYSITLDGDGSAKIKFTYNSTAKCPFGSRTTSVTSELPLEPAADSHCN
jgi:hypothetical protein